MLCNLDLAKWFERVIENRLQIPTYGRKYKYNLLLGFAFAKRSANQLSFDFNFLYIRTDFDYANTCRYPLRSG